MKKIKILYVCTIRTSILLLFFLLSLLHSCSSTSENKTLINKKANILFAQGTNELINKDYTNALDHLLQANNLQPNNSEIINNLGMAYFFKGRIDLASTHLKKAIELDPKNYEAKNNYASILFRLGKVDDAENIYLSLQKELLYKFQYRTYYNLAIINLKKNNHKLALEYLEKSLLEKSDYCEAHYLYGVILENNNSLDAALNSYKEASMGTCISLIAPQYKQAKIYIKKRDYEKAKIKLEYILATYKNDPILIDTTKELEKIRPYTTQKNIENKMNTENNEHNDNSKNNEIESYLSPSF